MGMNQTFDPICSSLIFDTHYWYYYALILGRPDWESYVDEYPKLKYLIYDDEKVFLSDNWNNYINFMRRHNHDQTA